MRYLLLLATLPLCAFDFPLAGKTIDPAVLGDQYKKAGYLVTNGVSCPNRDLTRCYISLDDAEKKDPQIVFDAYVYVDPAVKKAADEAVFRGLCDQLAAATISLSDLIKLTSLSQSRRQFCADLTPADK